MHDYRQQLVSMGDLIRNILQPHIHHNVAGSKTSHTPIPILKDALVLFELLIEQDDLVHELYFVGNTVFDVNNYYQRCV